MKKFTSTLVTTMVNSDDGLYNYEVVRTLQNVRGDKALLLTLYPSFSGADIFKLDTTTLHLLNHMKDLNLSSVRIINLFSKIVKGAKLSCRNLTVDEENLKYIEGVMKEKDFESYIFIVAWGSSMATSKAANQTKERIIKMFREYHPNSKLYQITSDYLAFDNIDAVHPLYLGIRNAQTRWKLAEYAPPTSFGKPESENAMKAQQKKISGKKKSDEEADIKETENTKDNMEGKG